MREASGHTGRFAAYLRGFETIFKVMVYMPHHRLQPTYEDLKPVILHLKIPSEFCLQPTYEDLKLNYDTQYETAGVVCSLPTRI